MIQYIVGPPPYMFVLRSFLDRKESVSYGFLGYSQNLNLTLGLDFDLAIYAYIHFELNCPIAALIVLRGLENDTPPPSQPQVFCSA